MRKPSAAMILSLLLALSWIGFFATQPRAAQPPAFVKWQYDSFTDNQPGVGVNDYGKNGWEAYAITVNKSSATYYLKRPTQ